MPSKDICKKDWTVGGGLFVRVMNSDLLLCSLKVWGNFFVCYSIAKICDFNSVGVYMLVLVTAMYLVLRGVGAVYSSIPKC